MRYLRLLFLTLLVAGCGGPSESVNVTPTQTPPQFIVSADAALSQFPQGRIVAAISVLEGSMPGLVAGAVPVDVDEWLTFSESPGGLFNLPGWNTRIGALGITPTTPVLIYDDGEMKFASRVRWLLAHYGVQNTRIIRGGYDALAGRLGPGNGAVAASSYQATIVEPPIPVIFKEQVAAALGNPSIRIVDLRIPAQYNGQAVLPGDARPGHIPGAVNFPLANLFGPDGNMLDDAGMLARFQAAGFRPDERLYIYCHDGAQSSLAASALVQVGYTDVHLYYLSYRNWSMDLALPVTL